VGNVTLVIPHNPVGGNKGSNRVGATSGGDHHHRGEKAMAKAARNEQRHNKTTPQTGKEQQPAQQTVAS